MFWVYSLSVSFLKNVSQFLNVGSRRIVCHYCWRFCTGRPRCEGCQSKVVLHFASTTMIVFVFMMRKYKGCLQLASFILMFPVHGDVFQVYCSVECRHADWDIHEMFCEQIQVNCILRLSLSMTVFTCGELLGWSFPLGRSYFNPHFS